jgi:hypothetical protein
MFAATLGHGGPRAFFLASATSSAATITIPASAAAGDLAVLFDGAQNSSGTPTTVVPSGFTSIGNVNGGTASFLLRAICSYRVLGAAEGGTSITGMDGTLSDNKIMLVFRPGSGSFSITASTPNGEATAGDPATQTVLAAAGTPPLIVFGYYRCSAALSGDSFSPTADSAVTNGAGATARYKYYETAPSDVTIDLADGGVSNALQSFYLKVF